MQSVNSAQSLNITCLLFLYAATAGPSAPCPCYSYLYKYERITVVTDT